MLNLIRMIDSSVRKGVVASCILAIGLVALTRVQNGANAAGHAATDLMMPIGLIWLLLFAIAVSQFFRGNRLACAFFFSVWIALSVSFNLLLAIAFFGSIEASPADSLQAHDRPLRAVIVLGGAATTNGHGVDEITADGERVLSAAQMWHAGETKAIICTGRDIDPSKPVPGEVGRRLLVSIGVPKEVVYVVGGEDTEEEMQCLRRFLDDPPEAIDSTGEIGLITSAFHMNRAMRKANEVSLELLPIPVAFRSYQSQTLSIQSLIPSTVAGEMFRIALTERLAKLLGK